MHQFTINSPFKDAHSHLIHTCFLMIASNTMEYWLSKQTFQSSFFSKWRDFRRIRWIRQNYPSMNRIKILRSVELHIGDSWGKMKTFALGHFHGETPNLRGVGNWKFCSRMRLWGATAMFPIFHNGQHQFCISIDTRKTGDPNFRGVGNWKFCSRTHFWGATAIFPIFRNGWHQFCISIDTQKTGDPNFRGLCNWKFRSRMHFWGATAMFQILLNGWHQFCISVDTRKTGNPNFRGGQ